jgi:hypothetical protein
MSLVRNLPLHAIRQSRCISTARPLFASSGGSTESSNKEHVTNSTDELDVHSSASKSGTRERIEDSPSSSASSEKDTRKDNERAQKDHPESPIVIGMNDERGSVCIIGWARAVNGMADDERQKGH